MTEDELTECDTVQFRERCKSSVILEERISSQLFISKNRTSMDSSTYSVNSNTPSIDSSSSMNVSVISHERNEGVITDDFRTTSTDQQDTQQFTKGQCDADSSCDKSKKMNNTEGDIYVFMAATDSIRQSTSSPLLSEDNVYVRMSPVPRQRKLTNTLPTQQDYSNIHKSQDALPTHDYYNLHSSVGSSMPDLTRHQSTENDEDIDLLQSTPQEKEERHSDVYEQVDYTRPIPPPRRKKLLKTQTSFQSSSEEAPSRLIIRHHSLIPTTSDSPLLYNQHNFSRVRTSTSPITVRKSPKRVTRKRPVGMVFNEITITEVLSDKDTPS